MQWAKIIVEFVIGCGLLAWGADRFIAASSALAKRIGMPPLIIGMLLVGFGTSFPELVVSAIAAWQNNPGIAIGNAIGSNIANIGLVVGITAVIVPISVHSQLLKKEFPILLVISLIVGALLWNNYLSRTDGVILIAFLCGYLYWLFFLTPKKLRQKDEMAKEYEIEIPKMSLKAAVIWWLVGLALLFVSSDLLVDAAVAIAKWLQVSDLVIGLTIVAIGTSLPELAACVVSALRHEHDIAIGNVVGSCVFNLVAVLAMPALISPGPIQRTLVYFDYPVMLLFIVVLWFFSASFIRKKEIQRIEGGILLVLYAAYLACLVLTA